jgi:hypothetical protein
MDLDDAEGLTNLGRSEPIMTPGDIVPRLQDFATVGHLYRSIEAGFAHLTAKLGEQRLFIGPPRAQATAVNFGWPELTAVTDLASAQRAIDEILEQGEGPRGNWQDAHFGQFVAILDEYQQLRATNHDFDPVRPVQVATVRPSGHALDVPLITDPLTARVTDLFNTGYEILLLALERYFAHTEESDAELATLADLAVSLMFRVIKPLGDLITSLPAGPEYPGRTAGPSFELFYETDYLIPHQRAAWIMLSERLTGAAEFSERIRDDAPAAAADALAAIGPALVTMAAALDSALTPAEAVETSPVPAAADAPIGYETHIKALFRERDRASMSFAFDLWAYHDVRQHAQAILGRLRAGSMPCDGAWPAERIELFSRWIEAGSPQ